MRQTSGPRGEAVGRQEVDFIRRVATPTTDMGPGRVAEIMIVRFGRNHLFFCRCVAATA